MRLAHQRDHLGHLSVGEAPAAAAARHDLALARRSQLGNQVRLLELANRPEDLPHEHCRRGVGREEIRRARWQQLDPERAQIVVPGDLHTEVARKLSGLSTRMIRTLLPAMSGGALSQLADVITRPYRTMAMFGPRGVRWGDVH